MQVKLDHTPQHAFGIKHSPYLGTLKDNATAGKVTTEVIRTQTAPRKTVTETVTYHPPKPLVANGHSGSNTTTTNTVVRGDAKTTTTTRVHSDGHRIRTETFSYTKGPTTTTSRVTTNRTSNTQVKNI